MKERIPTSIIIFGASGDLTRRKLIPSFFNLFRKRKTPKKFIIIGYGWTLFTDEQFREHLRKGLEEHAGYDFTEEEWSLFAPNIYYHQGKYDNQPVYQKPKEQPKKSIIEQEVEAMSRYLERTK